MHARRIMRKFALTYRERRQGIGMFKESNICCDLYLAAIISNKAVFQENILLKSFGVVPFTVYFYSLQTRIHLTMSIAFLQRLLLR